MQNLSIYKCYNNKNFVESKTAKLNAYIESFSSSEILSNTSHELLQTNSEETHARTGLELLSRAHAVCQGVGDWCERSSEHCFEIEGQ